MRFGSREICDVVFRARNKMTLGSRTFLKNEPVIYFDTLKTSSLEGAVTTVYAQGGRGNARLIAWDGEKTLTFNMEDALLTPESFTILSGAGLVDAKDETIYVHQTSQIRATEANKVVLPGVIACNSLTAGDNYKKDADIFLMVLDDNGEVNTEPCVPSAVTYSDSDTTITCSKVAAGDVVLVDYYVAKKSGAQQLEITADSFSGNFYIEASTLFRRESDGVDMPAEFVIPNGKVQSNFTFSMASSGDPSTFNFVVDAFPAYTKFGDKKVLALIQVIEEDEGDAEYERDCEKGIVEKTADSETSGG